MNIGSPNVLDPFFQMNPQKVLHEHAFSVHIPFFRAKTRSSDRLYRQSSCQELMQNATYTF